MKGNLIIKGGTLFHLFKRIAYLIKIPWINGVAGNDAAQDIHFHSVFNI